MGSQHRARAVGGSNRTVALQPISLGGQTGLNLAIGVAALHLGLRGNDECLVHRARAWPAGVVGGLNLLRRGDLHQRPRAPGKARFG
jgi:Protein of unknown function (DUF992)